MGGATSGCKINFEQMQKCVEDAGNTLIIHTMSVDRQHCLIRGTLTAEKEVYELNKTLGILGAMKPIVIYGENACDSSIVTKYNQLIDLGFSNVMVYPGGMFEWLLLQDIYGSELFLTSGSCGDILDYKGC